MRSWLLALALALPGTALAGYPDDITLSQLGSWDGESVTDADLISTAYGTVVKGVGVAIANKAFMPAETLGLSGFELSFTNNASFINAYDAEDPTAWQRTQVDGDPTRVLWVPTLGVRKGLPLSLEVGASLGYLAFSRQSVASGFGRWSIIEGYRSKAPDVTVQVGYSRYMGNDELQIGVMDASVNIGYTFGVSQLAGINHGTIAPFLGLGMDRIKASPRLSDSELAALGIGDLPCATADSCQEGFTPFAMTLGLQVNSNDAFARLGGSWSPGTLPTTAFSIGVSY